MKSYYYSPVGWLEITTSDEALRRIRFLETIPQNREPYTNALIRQIENELSEYFNHSRTDFSLPLAPGGTDFQQSIWQLLQEIPYGQTSSYGALAERLGDPKKVRAVGRANGQNPIPIVIPCHRIIGSRGNLIGYGGGIARKQFFLRHEGALLL